MKRSDFFYRQLLLESELDEAFDDVQDALEVLPSQQELGLHGMIQNGDVTENTIPPVPDLEVLVSGDAYGYGPDGKPIRWAAQQVVDCSKDSLDVATTVATPGNSKWLTLFARFKTNPTTPRLDGNGFTVYYRVLEDFEIFVAQGAEAVTPVRPPLRSDALILVDVLIDYGKTQIFNADLYVNRRQDFLRYTGASKNLVEGRVREGFESLLSYYNDHVTNGTDDRHGADDVDFLSYSWLSSSANVQEAFQEIVDDLDSVVDGLGIALIGYRGVTGAPNGSGGLALNLGSGGLDTQSVFDDLHSQLTGNDVVDDGAGRVGAQARTGSNLGSMPVPTTLSQGSIAYQLGQLADLVETLRLRGLTATQVSFTPYSWISSVNMQLVIQEIVDDLADSTATSGAGRIGVQTINWVSAQTLDEWLLEMLNELASTTASQGANHVGFQGYSWLSTGSVYDTFVELLTDLASTASTSGASRIGYDGYGFLSAGTVAGTFDQLVVALDSDGATPGTSLVGHSAYSGSAQSGAPVYSHPGDDLETVLQFMMYEINKRVARSGDTLYGPLLRGDPSVDIGSYSVPFSNLHGSSVYTNQLYYMAGGGPIVDLYFSHFNGQWSDPDDIDSYGAGGTSGYIRFGAADYIFLPLSLPEGCTIENIWFYGYIETPTIGQHTWRIVRRTWNSSTGTTVFNDIWVPGATGFFTRTANPVHILVGNQTYWLEYYTTGTAVRMYGVRVQVRLNQPNFGRDHTH